MSLVEDRRGGLGRRGSMPGPSPWHTIPGFLVVAKIIMENGWGLALVGMGAAHVQPFKEALLLP